MTPEMIECRTKRFHDWEWVGDMVTESRTTSNGTVIVLEFRKSFRCKRGCLTTGSVIWSAITWEPVSNFHYDHDPRYKVTGERIAPAVLRRERAIRDNPTLFHYLLENEAA
jgi:hypothetical protein